MRLHSMLLPLAEGAPRQVLYLALGLAPLLVMFISALLLWELLQTVV